MKLKIMSIILLTIILVSCNKTNISKTEADKIELKSNIENNNISEEKKEIEEVVKEDFILDTERNFIIEGWHPLKQTEAVDKLKKTLNELSNNSVDENLYNDDFTIEFALVDNRNRTFTLYHDIRKIDNYPIDDYEIYRYWGLDSVWCFKEEKNFSILWNNNNGAILIIETDDSNYSTIRGIRVGDSVEDVMIAYGKDSSISEYNYETKEFEHTSDHEAPCFLLLKSNECISINCGNTIDEEMMTISFLLNNGVVNKIVIRAGN